jgi:hypothetical protein
METREERNNTNMLVLESPINFPVLDETAGRVPQNRLQQDITRGQTTPRTPPAECAFVASEPLTTKAGLPRRRMKWTYDMNENIMRIFYKTTNLGTNTTGYRQQLHARFCEIYPQISVNEQRVSDQYRVILAKNLIPAIRLETIKNEIRMELQQCSEIPENTESNEHFVEQTVQNSTNNVTSTSTLTEVEPTQNHQYHNLVESLRNQIRTAMTEFEGMHPNNRPKLPKIDSSASFIINAVNKEVLPPMLGYINSLESLQTLIYCGALSIIRELGIQIYQTIVSARRNPIQTVPRWERRLQLKIERLRKYIGKVTQYVNGNKSKRIAKEVEAIMKNHRIHTIREEPNAKAMQCLDTLKQKLSVVATRMKRYKESNKRKRDNAVFEKEGKNFYRKMSESNNTRSTIYPTHEQIETFWKNQLSIPLRSQNQSCLEYENERMIGFQEMQYEEISTNEISNIIRKLHNWKSPGTDKIQNFWYKRFTCTHGKLAQLINEVINQPEKMPDYLMTGIIYLIPKHVCQQWIKLLHLV